MTERTWMWTMPEIADHLGVKLSTVQAYRSREQMPPPSGLIGRTPYWTDNDIQPWLRTRQRHAEN